MTTTSPAAIAPAANDASNRLSSSRKLIRRALARQIDMSLMAFVAVPTALYLSALLLAANPRYAAHLILTETAGPLLFGVIVLFLSLIAEALVLGFFGNTPGKRLAGLAVRNSYGRHLPMSRSIRRGLQIWAEGFLLTSSLVTFLAHAFQAFRLKRAGETTYDRRLDTRVIETATPGLVRKVMVWAVAILAFLFALSFTTVYVLRAAGVDLGAGP